MDLTSPGLLIRLSNQNTCESSTNRGVMFIRFLDSNEKAFTTLALSFIGGDYYLEISMSDGSISPYPDNHVYVINQIRIRDPVVGGGNMRNGFSAVARLFQALKFLSQQPVLPLFTRREPVHPWVFRHTDEGWGHIGIAVERGGTILLSLIPRENNLGGLSGPCSLLMCFPHAITPLPVYKALVELLGALRKDNLERPNDYGNHG